MTVLTSEQTTQAVRGLVYLGAHDFNGEIDLGDCRAAIKSHLSPISPPNMDKSDPVEELIEVTFGSVVYGQHAIEGSVRVIAKIRWPNLYERMKIGSPQFSMIEQPQVKHDRLTRNCLVAFSRVITKYNEELRRYRFNKKD